MRAWIGRQFWTDHRWAHGWRIQQHATTKLWRLIDSQHRVHVTGERMKCEQQLSALKLSDQIPNGKLVILLHGLMRTSTCMRRLGSAIEQQTDYEVAYFDYASSCAKVVKHAEALRAVIDGLPEVNELCLVGHSLGNIVARHAIAIWQREGGSTTLDKIHRIVMLGPPNQGSSVARQLSRNAIFERIFGPAGLELGPNWSQLRASLAVPHCSFGIIAGLLPRAYWNPLLTGTGDLVVSVDETRLDGASDFMLVPRLHAFLMNDKRVHRAVIAFFQNGRFT